MLTETALEGIGGGWVPKSAHPLHFLKLLLRFRIFEALTLEVKEDGLDESTRRSVAAI